MKFNRYLLPAMLAALCFTQIHGMEKAKKKANLTTKFETVKTAKEVNANWDAIKKLFVGITEDYTAKHATARIHAQTRLAKKQWNEWQDFIFNYVKNNNEASNEALREALKKTEETIKELTALNRTQSKIYKFIENQRKNIKAQLSKTDMEDKRWPLLLNYKIKEEKDVNKVIEDMESMENHPISKDRLFAKSLFDLYVGAKNILDIEDLEKKKKLKKLIESAYTKAANSMIIPAISLSDKLIKNYKKNANKLKHLEKGLTSIKSALTKENKEIANFIITRIDLHENVSKFEINKFMSYELKLFINDIDEYPPKSIPAAFGNRKKYIIDKMKLLERANLALRKFVKTLNKLSDAELIKEINEFLGKKPVTPKNLSGLKESELNKMIIERKKFLQWQEKKLESLTLIEKELSKNK